MFYAYITSLMIRYNYKSVTTQFTHTSITKIKLNDWIKNLTLIFFAAMI